jgi:twinkle protein
MENNGNLKAFKRPKWSNGTNISDKGIKWLESRGISQKTAIKMKLGEGLVFMPQKGAEVNTIQFPYYFNGELINVKYRDGAKNFRMEAGAELIFYNIDSVLNADTVIIVEGEMDCLSMIEAGYEHCVSVPNGASATSMSWLDHAMDYFGEDKKYIIAVDNDSAGAVLRDELIRRLGDDCCSLVVFKDCKDANECLQKYGIQGIIESMSQAKEVPQSGVYTARDIEDRIDNFYRNGLPKGAKLGVEDMDRLCSWHPGYFSVITGIPGMGKSEVVDFVCCRLNVAHGWKIAYYSPENYPLELHFSKIAEKLIGKPFEGSGKMNLYDLEQVKTYFNDNFFFIKPEEDLSLDSILNHVRGLIRRKGIKMFVIDAWNKLEHMYTTNETQYISKELDKLAIFCEKYQVHLALVAHPTKMNKDKRTGETERPNLYSISGSAAFFNKCSLGICIHRDKEGLTEFEVQKVKFKHWGFPGLAKLTWNRVNGRYGHGQYYDDTNWLNRYSGEGLTYNFKDEDGDAPF